MPNYIEKLPEDAVQVKKRFMLGKPLLGIFMDKKHEHYITKI